MAIRRRMRALLGHPIDIAQHYHDTLVQGHAIDLGPVGQRARRIGERLNGARPGRQPKRACVVWDLEHAACTQPGRWVYVTKTVANRLSDDDALAFVIAHEMAHHDLGHLMGRLSTTPATIAIASLARGILQSTMSHRLEFAADAHALELCRRARYDARTCLLALELFEGQPSPPGTPNTHPEVSDRLERLRTTL